jgi:hypothetical protein
MGSSSSIAASNFVSNFTSTHYLPVNPNIKLVFKTFNVDIGKEYYKQMSVPTIPSYTFQYRLHQYTTNNDFSNTDIRNTIMLDYISSDYIYDSDSISLSISSVTNEAKSRFFTEKDGIISLNRLPGKIYDKKQNGAYYITPPKLTEDYGLFLNRFLPLQKIPIHIKKRGRIISFYETYGTQHYFNFNHENETDYEGILFEIKCTKGHNTTTYKYFLSSKEIKGHIKTGVVTLYAN